MTHTIAITKLPYMGKTVEIATPRVMQNDRIVNFSALREYELEQVMAQTNDMTDPYEVLTRKVTHLAALLRCSEEQAERIILDRIGA